MKSVIRVISSFIAAIFIASCGFHLQAESVLPVEMTQTRLEIQNPYSPFARRLLNLLEQSGINIVETGDAGAVLEVPLNVVRKEILTIGDNARVREYRVRHTVSVFNIDVEAGDVYAAEEAAWKTYNEAGIDVRIPDRVASFTWDTGHGLKTKETQ